jgi:hypothetical protein
VYTGETSQANLSDKKYASSQRERLVNRARGCYFGVSCSKQIKVTIALGQKCSSTDNRNLPMPHCSCSTNSVLDLLYTVVKTLACISSTASCIALTVFAALRRQCYSSSHMLCASFCAHGLACCDMNAPSQKRYFLILCSTCSYRISRCNSSSSASIVSASSHQCAVGRIPLPCSHNQHICSVEWNPTKSALTRLEISRVMQVHH